jgi:hypothetical protein
MVADDNSQLDTDGYYGDDDADSEEIDLSFLNESESGESSNDDSNDAKASKNEDKKEQ